MAKLCFSLVLSNVLIVLSLILSFRAFAGFLAPDFDADQAVHILMAYDLQLPEDLYFWGQNRLGSLLPILSHWLLQISPFNPIQAVSYVQYLFVLVGFFCFASLLEKPVSKAIFALVWFLPANPFLKLVEVAHPYAPQLTLLGVSLVSTNRLIAASEKETTKRLIFSLITISSLITSIWVSDLSLVPAVLVLISVCGTLLKQYRGSYHQELGRSIASSQSWLNFRAHFTWIWIFSTLLLGGMFLAYAKSSASQQDENYGLSAINSLDITVHIIHSITVAVSETLLFQTGSPFLSLYAIAVLVSTTVLTGCFLRSRRINCLHTQLQWVPLLLISAVGTLALILMSRWTYIQDTPSRYFIGIYLFCWLAALLVFDTLNHDRLSDKNGLSKTRLNRVSTLLILTALLGSLSLPSYVFAIEKPQSRLSMLQPVASVGKAGFIGDYWASYLMCIVDPAQLSCTPHDQDFVRCSRCAQNAVEAPVIYLVGRDWLHSFPEEIEQFGQRLRKQQPAQLIAGYWMAPYRNLDR